MKKEVIIFFTLFSALVGNSDTVDARYTSGFWSDPAVWYEGIVPDSSDLVRIRANAFLTLNSEKSATSVELGIFNSETHPSLLIEASGSLSVSSDFFISPRIDNTSTLSLDGGELLVGGILSVGGTPTEGRSNAEGILTLNGGYISVSEDLLLGNGHANDNGASGTVNMNGGTLETERIYVGNVSSKGVLNLNDGILQICDDAEASFYISENNGWINIRDGILEWTGTETHVPAVESWINNGQVTWAGTTTNMLFDTWDYASTNATSIVYVRHTAGDHPATMIWSTASPSSHSEETFIVNTRWFRTHGDWSKLVPWNDKITALRLPGGSRGQWTWNREEDIPLIIQADPDVLAGQVVISDQMILEYAAFAAEKNVETYYALNVNDTLENQTNLLDRLLAAGINLTHVELGNETYLPKFRNGEPWGVLGLVEQITMSDYLSIADSWLPVLRDRYPSVNRLIVGASKNEDGYRNLWNSSVISFIQNNSSLCDGVVVHLYVGDSENPNEEEVIQEVFQELDSWDMWPLPMHITESGNDTSDYSEEGLIRYKTFQRRVFEYLQYRNDGSRMGTHVLHTEVVGGGLYAIMYDNNGITPIGAAAMGYPYEPLDTDQDLLPDWWERLYFGGPTNAGSVSIAANGINTVYETYLAGLNPNDLTDVFNINSVAADGGFQLHWQAVSGRVCSVWWAPDLSMPFTVIRELAFPLDSFTSNLTADPSGFYKLDIKLSH